MKFISNRFTYASWIIYKLWKKFVKIKYYERQLNNRETEIEES